MEKYDEYVKEQRKIIDEEYSHLSEYHKEIATYIRVSVRLFYNLETANEKLKKYEDK